MAVLVLAGLEALGGRGLRRGHGDEQRYSEK